MADVIMHELWSSRMATYDAKNPTLKGVWTAVGSANRLDVEAAAATTIPAVDLLSGLLLKNVSFTPLGGPVWAVEADYGRADEAPADGGTGEDGGQPGGAETPGDPPPEPQDADALGGEWSFTSSGESQKITQSLRTRYKISADDTAPIDFQRGINVGDEEVGGTDVGVRKLEFSLTLDRTFITLGYMKLLGDLTYTTNDGTFLGFKRGELLFTGATGSGRLGPLKPSDKRMAITYSFVYSKNRGPDVAISDDIVIPEFRGHEYVWCRYVAKTIVGPPKRTIQVPQYAYVERVYEEADFRKLRLYSAGA